MYQNGTRCLVIKQSKEIALFVILILQIKIYNLIFIDIFVNYNHYKNNNWITLIRSAAKLQKEYSTPRPEANTKHTKFNNNY